jgi:GH24 family phage-related lysozyme (muramidase)
MIKLREIIKEIMDTIPPAPSAQIQPASTNSFSSDFISYVKEEENGIKRGFDSKKNMWYPHKSAESMEDYPTIAYGHKIMSKSELDKMNKGISDEEASKLLNDDLQQANELVHEYIKRKYKTDLVLTQKQMEMLVEFANNLGGLDRFPKFVDAVLRNNKEIMRKEYKRFAGGKELEQRNLEFFDRYLK